MENFNLDDFAQMFDAALESDNPAVKKALRNFMMIAAIVHAQDTDAAERTMGPLETLLKEVGDLKRIVYDLQNNRTYKDQYKDYYKQYYGNPTWVYSPNTSISTSSGGPSWSSGSITSSTMSQLLSELKTDTNWNEEDIKTISALFKDNDAN